MELEVAILYFEHYQKWRQSRLLPLTRDNTPAHYCYTYTNTKYIEYFYKYKMQVCILVCQFCGGESDSILLHK